MYLTPCQFNHQPHYSKHVYVCVCALFEINECIVCMKISLYMLFIKTKAAKSSALVSLLSLAATCTLLCLFQSVFSSKLQVSCQFYAQINESRPCPHIEECLQQLTNNTSDYQVHQVATILDCSVVSRITHEITINLSIQEDPTWTNQYLYSYIKAHFFASNTTCFLPFAKYNGSCSILEFL